MAAVRWRHFWILLLWFLLVLQEQCAVRHENDFAWKHAALRIECFCHAATHVFCLRLLWQEDHVLISICCTSTIHLHFRPHGKHSTHCANRSDPCRKAPAFSVPSDGACRAYTLRRSWTWLICKVGAAQDSEHTVPLKHQVSLCALKQTSSSTIESSKRRRRRHAIKWGRYMASFSALPIMNYCKLLWTSVNY